MKLIDRLSVFVLMLMLTLPMTALSQSQDGTPAERDLMVIAELFEGRFDNVNQYDFDIRLNLAKELQHPRVHSIIERIPLPQFGEYVFWVQGWRDITAEPYLRRIYVFEADNDMGAVRTQMYIYDGVGNEAFTDAHLDLSKLDGLTPQTANYEKECDVFWHRELSHYRGHTNQETCIRELSGVGEAHVDLRFMLSSEGLWVLQLGFDEDGTQIYGNPKQVLYQMYRTRMFDCDADIPGVSDGGDVLPERHTVKGVHDLGGVKWFVSKDGREFGISLRNMKWPINDETGTFTRDSLVLSILGKIGEDTTEIISSRTEPNAQRIGINMGQMVVNCHLASQ